MASRQDVGPPRARTSVPVIYGAGYGRASSRAGVAGNARLIASLGAVLFVLLAAEGITILGIRPLLAWHVAIGMVIVALFVAKVGVTFHRFARYYLGDPAYREKGPPAVALRLAGPFVVLLTGAVLASGVALLYVPQSWRSLMLLAHKATFVLWFGVMAVHVLGHFVETALRAPRDWVPGHRRLQGTAARRATVVISLVVGVGLAVVVTPAAGHFFTSHPFPH